MQVLGRLASPEDYVEEAARFKASGWRPTRFIRPPSGDDIKICEAVRRAVGDDYTLMLDSTWTYEYPAALRVGRAIEALGFYWFEDPLTEWIITT